MKRIVAIGPESTGKSTLCASLSKHFSAPWCPEYAREYLQKKGKNYTYHDLLEIAKGQVKLEDELMQVAGTSPYYFIDTDLYVIKVWSEYVFGKCHSFILEQIALRKYDLYLLCNIDLPWEEDDLRECPDENQRMILFHIYKDLLAQQKTPWKIIEGDEENRFQCALKAIMSLSPSS
ncbi:MAG: ATP-binding protein [Bacteroidetes bacterium]|nr:ATP-binding protein [Bacteroidota bacterium]